jgi:hypothetical protein
MLEHVARIHILTSFDSLMFSDEKNAQESDEGSDDGSEDGSEEDKEDEEDNGSDLDDEGVRFEFSNLLIFFLS